MGEDDEFERMFEATGSAVLRYAIRRLGHAGAHDAVAETFLVAWRRRQEMPDDALPWLLGVARRVCANQLRSRMRQERVRARIASEPPFAPAQEPDHEGSAIFAALDRLRETDREALLLVAWDELTNEQAARAMGCSKTAFAVRLHRARRRLAAELEHEPEGEVAHEVG